MDFNITANFFHWRQFSDFGNHLDAASPFNKVHMYGLEPLSTLQVSQVLQSYEEAFRVQVPLDIHITNNPLISLGEVPVANSHDLLFPFLVVEFKSDGPSGAGSFWVAANQCLGRHILPNIIECFNSHLEEPISSVACSIALDATEARLFVSWKENSDFKMIKAAHFLLQTH